MLPRLDSRVVCCSAMMGNLVWQLATLALLLVPAAASALAGIVVSGAGTAEVNGVYLPNGEHAGVRQYLLAREDGRSFEVFRVASSQWWNIQEVRREGKSSVYLGVQYGALGAGAVPPEAGWLVSASRPGKPAWQGAQPAPRMRSVGAAEAELQQRQDKRFGVPGPGALAAFLARQQRRRLSYLVLENFLDEPLLVRERVLREARSLFTVKGNFPGVRTRSFATLALRDAIQHYLRPFAGTITSFPTTAASPNGAFQVSTSRDRTWVHTDSWNNWAGVLFLTPGAPHTSGTGIFRHKSSGATTEQEGHLRGLSPLLDDHSQDYTEWERIDTVGNVFNRLLLFDARQFHASLDYFGTNASNARKFFVSQSRFFNTSQFPR